MHDTRSGVRRQAAAAALAVIAGLAAACGDGTGDPVGPPGPEPGVPAALRLLDQPGDADLDTSLDTIRVEVLDAFGDPVAVAVRVSAALADGPEGTTLSGTTAVLSQDGVARFTELGLDRTGQHRLLFAAPELTPVTTDSFTIRFRLREIAAGGASACGITPSGSLYCWGSINVVTGLGPQPFPSVHRVDAPRRYSAVSASDHDACAIDADRGGRCWGSGFGVGFTGGASALAPSLNGLGATVESVVTGVEHTCARSTDGRLLCWGLNGYGEVGGTQSPVYPSGAVEPSGVTGAIAVSAGYYHTCAVVALPFRTLCWGDNQYGQLGAPLSVGSTYQPQEVPQPSTPGDEYAAVAAGQLFTCAATQGGETFCWGEIALGAFGTWDPDPDPRGAGFPVVRSLSAGVAHVCAVAVDGSAWCVGRGSSGQLGDGKLSDRSSPVRVAGDQEWRQLAAGDYFTCGITVDLEPFCWGDNRDGALGSPDLPESQPVPVRLPDPVLR